mmetsp:Transcript_8320/g.12814  ORF Transcript_8320/g.12814 Transcript_8320/m.12814 type:complete len:90 (+) Transcript_8320:810-1079(+)
MQYNAQFQRYCIKAKQNKVASVGLVMQVMITEHLASGPEISITLLLKKEPLASYCKDASKTPCCHFVWGISVKCVKRNPFYFTSFTELC